MPSVRIRPLVTPDELHAGVELQHETWGRDFDDIVSSALMQVAQKIGGVAAGAFDSEDRLIGMIFGLTGIRNDARVHWSHMLAVRPPWRGHGLGTILKAYQRRRALALGVDHMYWTFDPLESRNAHFNINRLGVEIETYVPDMYGSGETSTLHSGIGTDRFIARWPIRSPRVERLLEAVEYRIDWGESEALADLPRGPARSIPESDGLPLEPAPSSNTGRVSVEIPQDIQRLKREHPEEAADWRMKTRRAFTLHLSSGMAITSFVRDSAPGRCYYILESVPKP